MPPALREEAAVRRYRWLVALALVLIPQTSRAIQLHWSTGASDLSFISATRCTLVVQADAQEHTLPHSWRLLWVTDSCSIHPLALDPAGACLGDIAQAATVVPPSTPADSVVNMTTAVFCSAPTGTAVTAFFVLDLPAGTSGKLKVAAIDPADPESLRVIQSPEATFNGGVSDPYPPMILRTSTVHHSTEFRLSAVGVGLADTRALSLVAPDASWQLPLSIASQSDTAISATAAVAASVPNCVVEAQTAGGNIASAPLSSDPTPPPLEPQSGCQDNFVEAIYPPDMIQPKDFSFTAGWTPAGNWYFHLFYIRQNQATKLYHGGLDFTEKNLGHASSNNLHDWTVLDTASVKVRSGRFDSKHVWAPSIVLRGLTYYMFYTGVDDAGNQRMGLATSTDLINWVQGDSIFSAGQAGSWVDPTPSPGRDPYHGQTQFRDPFVMQDPNVAGDWLMYFVTVAKPYTPGMVVGVARSHGDFTSWSGTTPFWSTRFPYPTDTTAVVESPHAFLRNGKWWMFYTVNGDSVWAEANATSPTDTTKGNWSQVQKLRTLVPPTEATAYNFWHATEYLDISDTYDIRYLAAYNDANESISYTRMRAADPYLFTGECPSPAGVDESAVTGHSPQLVLLGLRPARSQVGLRIELPGRMRVFLAVYDVLGRRVRTLVDGELPAGATELSWDGHAATGAVVGSGVYFASLTAAGDRHSVRVPIVR